MLPCNTWLNVLLKNMYKKKLGHENKEKTQKKHAEYKIIK